jgi:hypothetical protein
MKEQLVNFETAKLAKEKGFDMIDCTNAYNVFKENLKKSGEGLVTTESEEEPYYGGVSCILRTFYQCKNWTLAPTQSLLQKWLREKYNIHCEVLSGKYNGVKRIRYESCVFSDLYKEEGSDNYDEKDIFDVYEDALTDSIQEALTLIKIK